MYMLLSGEAHVQQGLPMFRRAIVLWWFAAFLPRIHFIHT
jgi:hypothetical protein